MELLYAAQNDQLQVVRDLLNQGADIHYQNDMPLRIAVFHGHVSIIQELFNRGVSIKRLSRSLQKQYRYLIPTRVISIEDYCKDPYIS